MNLFKVVLLALVAVCAALVAVPQCEAAVVRSRSVVRQVNVQPRVVVRQRAVGGRAVVVQNLGVHSAVRVDQFGRVFSNGFAVPLVAPVQPLFFQQQVAPLGFAPLGVCH